MGTRPQASGRVILVFELERSVKDPPEWIRAVLSIPGREGTVTRVLGTVDGVLTTDAAVDFVCQVGKMVDEALAFHVGIQAVLPVT
jgi:hypothetical protein